MKFPSPTEVNERIRKVVGACPRCGSIPQSGYADINIEGQAMIRLACLEHEIPVELESITNIDELLDLFGLLALVIKLVTRVSNGGQEGLL